MFSHVLGKLRNLERKKRFFFLETSRKVLLLRKPPKLIPKTFKRVWFLWWSRKSVILSLKTSMHEKERVTLLEETYAHSTCLFVAYLKSLK